MRDTPSTLAISPGPRLFRQHLRPAYNGAMEHQSLEYKIVMDEAPDSEVLGRLAILDIAGAAYIGRVQATLRSRAVRNRHLFTSVLPIAGDWVKLRLRGSP
jgi:hypothetical protein